MLLLCYNCHRDVSFLRRMNFSKLRQLFTLIKKIHLHLLLEFVIIIHNHHKHFKELFVVVLSGKDNILSKIMLEDVTRCFFLNIFHFLIDNNKDYNGLKSIVPIRYPRRLCLQATQS